MNTKIVTVDLDSRSYDIYIGAGLLYRFADFVPVDIKGRRLFIVTDENVESYAGHIRNILINNGAKAVEIMTLPAGEHVKSFKYLERISGWLLDHNIDRETIICAVGGGVIGDITGFAASVMLRGIPYIQVPTTVLAQVDSSVGGKTAINVPQGKNLMGSFYQPLAVVADIDTLKTLPKREIIAGYAEIIKYGLINDRMFFNWLENNMTDVIDITENEIIHAVEKSVKAKAAIVEADEKEQGQRMLLNLGHTFGHALEAAAAYDGRLLHGEAVAIGMVMAFDLSVRMGLCDRTDLERIEEHLIRTGLPTRASLIQPALNASVDELMKIMRHDKKASDGTMRFIVANGIGEAFVSEDVPPKLVREVLENSLGESRRGGIARSFGNKGVKGLWKSVFSSQS